MAEKSNTIGFSFFKTVPEDNLETKVSRMIKTMEGLVGRLERIEAKMPLLATKADLQAVSISDKANKNLVDKFNPFKFAVDSAAANPFTKAAAKDSASSGFTGSLFASPDNRRGVPTAFTLPQSGGNDDQTIIVKGFDSSLPEDDIKSALSQYFSSCGQIISVVVPKNQVSGAVIGCVYIHLKKGVEKALKLNGSYLGGWKLVVEKVTPVGDNQNGQWSFPYRCNGLGQCSFC